MQTKTQKPWYQLKHQIVMTVLASRPGGLTSEEVAERLAESGKNKLPEAKVISPWRIFFEQVKSPLVYILVIAAIVSFAVGEMFDVIVIMAMVIINTLVGFWQEYKADKSIAKLQSMITYEVTVKRDGKHVQIPSEQLVPGDIMLLEAGDRISADARLFQVNDFETSEASLTGESFPVKKQIEILDGEATLGDRVNMVYSGTSVAKGRGRAVVVAIGSDTEIGQITSLVQSTQDEETPLQKEVKGLSKVITVLVVIAALAVFFVGIWQSFPIEEILVTAAALAVAAIPEGLLIALTLVLVVGMQRILRRRALVRKLVAAETLGSVSIVCSDKTGTITQGKMQVDQIYVGGISHEMDAHLSGDLDHKQEEYHLLALKAMTLCNNAFIKNPQDKLREWDIAGDSTDAALLLGSMQAGFDKEKLNQEYGRIDEIPFNELYKFQATLHYLEDDGNEVFVKGAPESVLEMCSHFYSEGEKKTISKSHLSAIQSEYEMLTKKGLRVLALAHQHYGKAKNSFAQIVADPSHPTFHDLIFIGWVGLKDPVRPNVPRSFQIMKKAGIRTVIVTGDHKFTVKAIVAELGSDISDERIIEGKDLDTLDENQLYDRIESIDIFARVEPKHKLRIVNAWKRKGEIVAMLGDGVNDAPALKAADIGIAVGDATDVAKETSDMVLLDGDFSILESAIREGRVMFDNIRKIFTYLMVDSFTEVMLIILALIAGLPLPLIAVQILWINVLSDGIINLALTVDPAEDGVMERPPRPSTEPIVNSEVKALIAIFSFTAIVSTLGLFLYYLSFSDDINYVRTVAFTALAIPNAFYVFSLRNLSNPFWKVNPVSNPWLVFSVLVTLALQVFVVYSSLLQPFFKTVPLHLDDWVLIAVITAIQIIAIEAVKLVYWRKTIDKMV